MDSVTDKTIRVAWCLSQNFGDALNPYLIEKLTGKRAVYVASGAPTLKYLMVGSILHWAKPPCKAWGAGLARASDPVDPKVEFLAVRGPLTRKIAIHNGASCPEVYGDPALLLPRVYQPKVTRFAKVALIPHYADQELVFNRDWQPEVKLINVFDPPEKVIDDICSCEAVISSSLHGLIAADAYGIPSAWCKLSPEPIGDGTKFKDHLSTVDVDPYPPYSLADVQRLDRIVFRKARVDVTRLLAACPFELIVGV
jgi:hypothetical protein